MGSYIPLGKQTGATPDGRRAGDPLSDATSPSLLAPALGPTAAHRSNTKAIDAVHTPNGVTFNQKFNLATVESERDLSKWADLVRTFVESGGQSVQYNVVDAATLRAAQKDPLQYKDLIVRVGGYSALFVDLSEELQETIIARAEQPL
jgi:formate C-acetyltransferase